MELTTDETDAWTVAPMPIDTHISLMERFLEKVYVAVWALSLLALPAIPLAGASYGWMAAPVAALVGSAVLMHLLDVRRSRRFAQWYRTATDQERRQHRVGIEARLRDFDAARARRRQRLGE